MEVKKHAFIPCHAHKSHKRHCSECLVATIVHLCELLEEDPSIAHTDEPASSNGLLEVFQGTHVAHVTEGKITNVTALPMSPADLEEGIVRYTVEFRKDS